MNVLILEDHPLLIEVTSDALSSLVDEMTVFRALSLDEAKAFAGESVDLVFSDVMLPGSEPEEVIDCMGSMFPRAKTVFLTSIDESSLIDRIESAGHLYLHKSSTFAGLVKALQDFLDIHKVKTDTDVSRNAHQCLVQASDQAKPLTIRQAAVMERVCSGKTSKEIAKELGMSPDTVRSHLKEAYNRLGCSQRSAAVTPYLDARKTAVRLYGEEAVMASTNYVPDNSPSA